MHHHDRIALRVAGLIHTRYRMARCRQHSVHFPDTLLSQAHRLRDLVGKASLFGWHLAAQRLRRNLGSELDYCRTRLADHCEKVLDVESTGPTPSHRDLYQDILALEREFPEMSCDAKAGELSVTTDPITLQNIKLGPFAIQLLWKRLPDVVDYRVVALKANPAKSHLLTTHPHVRNEELCEGNGMAAIRDATREGRLFDFFHIVSQLLHTYAKGSAYVELSDWHSAHCQACADWVADCGRSCSDCDVPLCERCTRSCIGCGDDCCSRCLFTCVCCRELFCESCLAVCTTCDEHVCDNCRSEDLCERCYDTQHEDANDKVGGNSGTAIQPDGVGQAAVST